MTQIKSGGQLGSLSIEGHKTLTEISVGVEDKSSTIILFINQSSLSYLSIEEAMALRNELNEALKKAVGL